MKIKYAPQSEADQNNELPIQTNIGSFLVGQVVVVQPSQEAEAQRLVDNGDFEITADDTASDDEKEPSLVQKAASAAKAALTPKSSKK